MLIVLLHEIIKEKGFISANVLVEPQGIIENNNVGVRKISATNNGSLSRGVKNTITYNIFRRIIILYILLIIY